MQFGNAHFVLLAAAVPLLLVLFRLLLRRSHARLCRFADEALLPGLQIGYPQHRRRRRRRAWWSAAVLLLLLLALLRPQWGYTWKESSKLGVDIALAVDVSDSMLAQDITPSRLVRARREIIDLIHEARGDRIGLVAFSGVAFTETPLTLDYGALRNFVSSLSPELIPVKGTNIAAALEESLRTLQKGSVNGENAARAQAIVLITDGESFDGDVEEAGRKAAELGIKIYIVGIGTPQGAPIPSKDGYKKDKQGRVVISRLQPKALEQLADETGGVYVQSISSDQDTLAIYNLGIRKQLEAKALEWGRSKRWNEYFQAPLLLGLLLLLCGPWGTLLELRRRRETRQRPPVLPPAASHSIGLLLLAAAVLPPGPVHAESAEALGARARSAYEQGEYQDAAKAFLLAAKKRQDDSRFLIGQGAARYRMNEFDKAKALFFEAASRTGDAGRKAEALYNAGNSLVQLGELKEAIRTYEDALALYPEDVEAQENLAYAKRLLEQQQKQKQQQKDEQQKQQDKQNQQQQDAEDQQQDSQEKQNNQNQQQKDSQQEQNEQEQQQEDSQQKQNEQEQQQEDSQQEQNEQEQQQQQDSQQKQNEQEQQQDSQQKQREQEQQQEDSQQEQSEQNQQDAQNQQQDDSQEEHQQQAGAAQQPQRPSPDALEKDQQSDGLPGAGSEKKGELDPQSEMQLQVVEEKPNARFNYRFKQAMKQLRSENRKPPEKDW